uniref:Endoplasmic reticulum transmembrane protein n=1 Tax=Ananas comosus var. bracteatus TaxID=296719 RepID=A0A6V7PPI5_ANACO|nr:unnamed protein product [Ananas comosus var. bracteatus]
MALQWVILSYVVAAEAVVALLLTFPAPKPLKSRLVALIALVLQPASGILPSSHLYWKNEHRLMCTSEICTAEERIRYEKSMFKAQRNVILCVLACLLYWCIYRICKYHRDIKELEEAEKRLKAE